MARYLSFLSSSNLGSVPSLVFGLLLAIFLALGLVVPHAGSLLGCLLILCAGLWMLLGYCSRHKASCTDTQQAPQTLKRLAWIIASFGALECLSLLLAQPDYWAWYRLDLPSRYFLVLPLVFVCYRVPIASHWVFLGACMGAIAAGMVAHWEYQAVLPMAKGEAGHHILFGNLSVLLGLFSLSIATQYRAMALKWIAALAGLGGAVASYYSTARGAWLGLVVLLLLWGLMVWRPLTWRKGLIIGGCMLITLFAATALLPEVSSGLAAIQKDWIDYQQHHIVDSSIGARLEMWQAARHIFIDHPVLGSGPKTFVIESQALMAEGKVGHFGRYDHAHNQGLHTLSSTGLLGFFSLLLLIGYPLLTFCKHYRLAPAYSETKRYALVGIHLCAGYIVFGLTETMFDRHLSILFFLIMISLCAGQCLRNSTLTSCQKKAKRSHP